MKSNLQRKQLDKKLSAYKAAQTVNMPINGWVKAIRTTIGMSLEQLGNKLNVSKQNIRNIEEREQDGNITIKSLRDVANAMDMDLVYALVPKDENLEALIARKAEKLAKEIVMRTTQTMALEDQENGKERLLEAIEERKQEIIHNLPKMLWD
ncbi:anaerobic benzoate catabolism transcriptional regulator [Algoriella xinjiangensis]|uniref:mobile mystery protein A n=1 Tax=Algoriella xinjiangensis TaxID=684065 RepID=UPI000F62CDA6|nr:mobile mystery protein A [Algoriella xinjiangensis]VDH17592.1 anaerobic benzoate catabolism transcriptional regulator [Algoriella xinjiangensis]